MQSQTENVGFRNMRTLLMVLAIAALVCLLPAGIFAGFALSLIVAGWLIVGRNTPLRNREVVIAVTAIVVLATGLMAYGAAIGW